MKNILFLACMLYSSISFSQTTEPEKQVKEFFKQLNTLPKNQDPELITNLLTDDFTRFYYRDTVYPITDIKEELNYLVENSVLHPNEITYYKIEKNIKTINSDNFSVFICKVRQKYSSPYNTEDVNTDFIFTFILEKKDAIWKINHIGSYPLIEH